MKNIQNLKVTNINKENLQCPRRELCPTTQYSDFTNQKVSSKVLNKTIKTSIDIPNMDTTS